jgi:hypothetical protein
MSRRILAIALLACAVSSAPAAAQDKVGPNEVPDLSGLPEAGFSLTEIQRIIRGFRISPVRLDLRGKNAALVGLGSYVVNAQGGCNDCHTNPPYAAGGDPFAGQPKRVNAERYLAGGTPFGPFVSRNLTPDAEGRPAGFTFAQFRRTLRTGVDLKHLPPHVPSETQDLLQVMPWPVFQDMLDHDLRAIYEFLRAIPSRPSAPRP